jgi:hypothetical protein
MRPLWLPVLVASCTPSAFGPNGYAHPEDLFHIRSSSPTVVADQWILESHYGNAPDAMRPKDGPDYAMAYEFDRNDDGETDMTRERPLYDVRWEHSVDSCAIWIRTTPTPSKLANKDRGPDRP